MILQGASYLLETQSAAAGVALVYETCCGVQRPGGALRRRHLALARHGVEELGQGLKRQHAIRVGQGVHEVPRLLVPRAGKDGVSM